MTLPSRAVHQAPCVGGQPVITASPGAHPGYASALAAARIVAVAVVAALSFGACGSAEASETWSCAYQESPNPEIQTVKVTVNGAEIILADILHFKTLYNDRYFVIAVNWQIFTKHDDTIVSTFALTRETGNFKWNISLLQVHGNNPNADVARRGRCTKISN